MTPYFYGLYRLLGDVDKSWSQVNNDPLRQEQEQWLAMAMNGFVEKSLGQLRRHRELFPALQPSSSRLEFLLRSLGFLGSMRAFRQVCPFNRGVRFEIVNALRKGSQQFCQTQMKEANRNHPNNPIVHFASSLVADLQIGQTYYHSIFDNTNGKLIHKLFDLIP